jgi:hypothetical protein
LNDEKCPYCGSIDVEEANLCECCEEWRQAYSYDGEYYCDECVEYIKKKFGDLITNNFDAKERKLIYWCIDVNTWINKD